MKPKGPKKTRGTGRGGMRCVLDLMTNWHISCRIDATKTNASTSRNTNALSPVRSEQSIHDRRATGVQFHQSPHVPGQTLIVESFLPNRKRPGDWCLSEVAQGDATLDVAPEAAQFDQSIPGRSCKTAHSTPWFCTSMSVFWPKSRVRLFPTSPRRTYRTLNKDSICF